MKTVVNITIEPFQVPDSVIEVNNYKSHTIPTSSTLGVNDREPHRYYLSELSRETLAKLCEDFTKEVFKKAGKNQPPQAEKD